MRVQFNITEAEQRLGVKFKDKQFLITAFTHSSYANENKTESNERLEFLGDSILGAVVTEKIYSLVYLNEGNLSKLRSLLVSETPLAAVVANLNVEPLMLKGVGESKNKVVSNAVKCDLYEAIIGAIYLDRGIEAVREFVERTLNQRFNEVLAMSNFEDSKTRLQETLPRAEIKYFTSRIGDETNPRYRAIVKINGVACGSGEAGNKRTSEQIDASQALRGIKKV